MKSESVFILPVFVFFFFFLSCSGWKTEETYLQSAKQYRNISLDTCFMELQKIRHPSKLSPVQQSEYGVLMTICRLVFQKEISSDTLVENAIHYYDLTRDTLALMDALYYSGMENRVLNNNSKAILQLYRADSLALILGNTGYQEMIQQKLGFIYHDLEQYKEALDCYRKAIQYALQGNSHNEWIHYWDLGLTYRDNKDYPNAILSLEKALEVADSVHIKNSLSRIYNQLAELNMEVRNYKSAAYYVGLSQEFRTKREEAPIYNLTKGKLFMETQQFDSARVYLMKAIQSPNQYASISGYSLLSRLEHWLGNPDEAYLNDINEMNSFSSLYSTTKQEELSKKYTDEKLKNENNLLKLAKREREIYLLILCIVLILAFVVFFILYTDSRRKKAIFRFQVEEQALRDKAQLLENQNLLLQQEQELSALREKAAVLRASVFRKMSIAEKIPSLDSQKIMNVPENKKITLTEKDWSELIRTIDEAYPGFTTALKTYFPDLNKEDLCFCCLVKIRVNMQDLSDIYCISKAGITKKKTRMKKEKLGIMDDTMTLDDFLQSF